VDFVAEVRCPSQAEILSRDLSGKAFPNHDIVAESEIISGRIKMIVEMRTYNVQNGATAECLRVYEAEGLAIQKKVLGNLIGYFYSEIGPLNQIIHLWGFKDLNDRQQRRANQNSRLAKISHKDSGDGRQPRDTNIELRFLFTNSVTVPIARKPSIPTFSLSSFKLRNSEK
jgi:hypothetical protein